jgi:hypothetical protein
MTDSTTNHGEDLAQSTEPMPVLRERQRIESLLRGDGATVTGCGYAFDGTADISYLADGRSYWVEIRDTTEE